MTFNIYCQAKYQIVEAPLYPISIPFAIAWSCSSERRWKYFVNKIKLKLNSREKPKETNNKDHFQLFSNNTKTLLLISALLFGHFSTTPENNHHRNNKHNSPNSPNSLHYPVPSINCIEINSSSPEIASKFPLWVNRIPLLLSLPSSSWGSPPKLISNSRTQLSIGLKRQLRSHFSLPASLISSS